MTTSDAAEGLLEPRVLLDPSTLPANFDSGAGRLRLLLLVSPTCPVCLEGVEVVRGALRELEQTSVAAHVIWLPVLDGDTWESTLASARNVEGIDDVTHYWDADLFLSERFHRLLDFAARGRRVAWDLYLLYGREARWTADPPTPDVWMHQLRLEDVPALEQSLLVRHLRQMTDQL